ncbi:MAG: hypothetical protein V3T10_00565 [Candidatus Bathyarchaeia archaeon]
MDPTEFAISVIVSTIIVAPLLWLSGRTIVGSDKARLTDAIWIVLLGIIIGTAFGYFLNGLVGFIIQLIIWLALVKHFFDCGWLSALAIAIFAIVIFAVVVFILGIIGLGILILVI